MDNILEWVCTHESFVFFYALILQPMLIAIFMAWKESIARRRLVFLMRYILKLTRKILNVPREQ